MVFLMNVKCRRAMCAFLLLWTCHRSQGLNMTLQDGTNVTYGATVHLKCTNEQYGIVVKFAVAGQDIIDAVGIAECDFGPNGPQLMKGTFTEKYNVTQSYQTCTLTILNLTEELRGTYICAQMYNESKFEILNISPKDVEPDLSQNKGQPGSKTVLIIASISSVLGAVIVIIITCVCLKYKRKKRNSVIKDEEENTHLNKQNTDKENDSDTMSSSSKEQQLVQTTVDDIITNDRKSDFDDSNDSCNKSKHETGGVSYTESNTDMNDCSETVEFHTPNEDPMSSSGYAQVADTCGSTSLPTNKPNDQLSETNICTEPVSSISRNNKTGSNDLTLRTIMENPEDQKDLQEEVTLRTHIAETNDAPGSPLQIETADSGDKNKKKNRRRTGIVDGQVEETRQFWHSVNKQNTDKENDSDTMSSSSKEQQLVQTTVDDIITNDRKSDFDDSNDSTADSGDKNKNKNRRRTGIEDGQVEETRQFWHSVLNK